MKCRQVKTKIRQSQPGSKSSRGRSPTAKKEKKTPPDLEQIPKRRRMYKLKATYQSKTKPNTIGK